MMADTKQADHLLEAVKLRSAASTSLLTSAGSTGAAGVALIAFASGLHVVPVLAVVLWSLAGLLLFSSAVAGGWAIRTVTHKGADGDWSLDHPRTLWWIQIGAFFFGVLALTVGSLIAFSGPTRSSAERQQDRTIGGLSARLTDVQAELDRLRNQVNHP